MKNNPLRIGLGFLCHHPGAENILLPSQIKGVELGTFPQEKIQIDPIANQSHFFLSYIHWKVQSFGLYNPLPQKSLCGIKGLAHEIENTD